MESRAEWSCPPLPQVSQQEGKAGKSPGMRGWLGTPSNKQQLFSQDSPGQHVPGEVSFGKVSWGVGALPGHPAPHSCHPLTAADISPWALAFVLIHPGFALPSQD